MDLVTLLYSVEGNFVGTLYRKIFQIKATSMSFIRHFIRTFHPWMTLMDENFIHGKFWWMTTSSMDEKISSMDEKTSSMDKKTSSMDEKISSMDENFFHRWKFLPWIILTDETSYMDGIVFLGWKSYSSDVKCMKQILFHACFASNMLENHSCGNTYE